MVREKLKPQIASFAPEGDFLSILSQDGTVKIWDTTSGNLLAEWKDPNEDYSNNYSCMKCSFIGKKRRKERGTLLLALGTNAGDIMAINVFTGERKWTFAGCHQSGIAGLFFANKGRKLHIVCGDGMASELDTETGELIKGFKASKKPISSATLSCDEKVLAIASAKIRVYSLENNKELQKSPTNVGSIQHIAISDGVKTIITSGFANKQLQVWDCDSMANSIATGPILFMHHSPVLLECKNSQKYEDGLVILSVSETNVTYVWELKTILQENVNPTKITIRSNEAERDNQKGRGVKKSRVPVIAARLHSLQKDGPVSVLLAYGPIDCPHFSLLEITNPGEDIVVTATDDTIEKNAGSLQENGDIQTKDISIIGHHNMDLEAMNAPTQGKKKNKKRAASDPDISVMEVDVEATNGLQFDDDLCEPTMGEKLASLNSHDNEKAKSNDQQNSSPGTKPPSADSVHVLLKQALHADDRALLLDCLYTRDEKVIANSTSLLNPSDILKLLEALVSIIQSRGAVLSCALPWLRSLLLQHASSIMSQESSLLALNSLYQLIESRVSTFKSALQVSSCLDWLYAGVADDVEEENRKIAPVIYEDKDDSDEEEESEDAMETDQDREEVSESMDDFSDFEENDDIVD